MKSFGSTTLDTSTYRYQYQYRYRYRFFQPHTGTGIKITASGTLTRVNNVPKPVQIWYHFVATVNGSVPDPAPSPFPL
jgi:hypothetical protein